MTASLNPEIMLGTIVALGFVIGLVFGSLPRQRASATRGLRLPVILAGMALVLLALEWAWEPPWLHGRTAWRVELGLALIAAYALGTVLVRAIQGRARRAR